MLGALDHTAADALEDFQGALRRAQGALQREEARLAQLAEAVRRAQEGGRARRGAVRGQQQPRLEALRREVTRVRSIAARRKEEAAAQQRHVEAVRQPRLVAEAQCTAHRASLQQLRRKYIADSAAVHAQLLEWWRPQNSLASLEAQVASGEADVAALRGDVDALRLRLRELSGDDASTVAEKKKSDGDAEEKKAAEGERAASHGNGGAQNEAAGTAGDCDDSPACLGRQLARQEEERAAFERHSADTLALRRGEVERLKTSLKQLCADVEAADAAQQTAQQAFHAALNQQGDVRASCRVCGKEIVDSFVA